MAEDMVQANAGEAPAKRERRKRTEAPELPLEPTRRQAHRELPAGAPGHSAAARLLATEIADAGLTAMCMH